MKKLKVVCGAIAVALAIYNFANGMFAVGMYWSMVTAYWVSNFIGG